MGHGAKIIVTCLVLVAASTQLPEMGWIGPLLVRSDFEALASPFQRREQGDKPTDGLSLEALAQTASHRVLETSVKPVVAEEIPQPQDTETLRVQTSERSSPFQNHSLERLYEAMARAKRGDGPPVHVVQLGDSEIASDAVTMTIRDLFSKAFSDGGPGFVLAMRPWPSYSRAGLGHADPEGFKVRSYPRKQSKDKRYGPGGVGFDAIAGRGAAISLRTAIVGTPCRVNFLYLQQPKGRQFKLLADGSTFRTGQSAGPLETTQVETSFERCPKRLAFRTRGTGRFRVFGWRIHSQKSGMSWSSLGVNGARLSHLAHYADGALIHALKLLEPDAVVFSYGLNVTAHSIGPNRRYPGRVKTLLSTVRTGMSTVPCIVLGPYAVATKIKDRWVLSPTLAKVIHAQRSAADENGCLFIDRFKELGGAAALNIWRRKTPKMLSGDNVHLTREGARRMGHFVFNRLMVAFDRLLPRVETE